MITLPVDWGSIDVSSYPLDAQGNRIIPGSVLQQNFTAIAQNILKENRVIYYSTLGSFNVPSGFYGILVLDQDITLTSNVNTSSQVTILVAATITIDSGVTLNIGKDLIVVAPGYITGGGSLTVQGEVLCLTDGCLDPALIYQFNNASFVMPDWWVRNASPGSTVMTNGLNKAIGSGCKKVILRPTQYLVNSTVTLTAGVSLIGYGGATIIATSASVNPVMYFNGGCYIEGVWFTNMDSSFTGSLLANGSGIGYAVIKDCYFYGYGTGSSSGVYITGSSTYGLLIRDCVFYSNIRGIVLDSAYNVSISGCAIYGRSNSDTACVGVAVSGTSARCLVTGCVITNCYRGIYLSGSSYTNVLDTVRVVDNVVSSCFYGIDSINCVKTSIEGNKIKQTSSRGIVCNNLWGCRVTNNTIADPGAEGIYLSASNYMSSAVFSGNIITGATNGIYHSAGSGIVYSNNVISSCSQYGIYVVGSTSNSGIIIANSLGGNTSGPTYIGSGANFTVVNNV